MWESIKKDVEHVGDVERRERKVAESINVAITVRLIVKLERSSMALQSLKRSRQCFPYHQIGLPPPRSVLPCLKYFCLIQKMLVMARLDVDLGASAPCLRNNLREKVGHTHVSDPCLHRFYMNLALPIIHMLTSLLWPYLGLHWIMPLSVNQTQQHSSSLLLARCS